MDFEMRIADVFKLSSGYIIFVGKIVGTNNLSDILQTLIS
jgi:hypothetical protein